MLIGVSERAFQGVTQSFHPLSYQFSLKENDYYAFRFKYLTFSVRNVSHHRTYSHSRTASPHSSQRLSGWCRLLSFLPISHGRSSLQDCRYVSFLFLPHIPHNHCHSYRTVSLHSNRRYLDFCRKKAGTQNTYTPA